jgi:hypothetical protein
MLWNAARTWAAIRQRNNRQRPLSANVAVRWPALQRMLPIGALPRAEGNREPMGLTPRAAARIGRQTS